MPKAHETDRGDLLTAVDGMLCGEDPAQGVVRGRSFQHPGLRIALEAPPGFKLQNSPTAVAGSDGQGRLMLLDMAPNAVEGDLRGYLQDGWVSRQRLQQLQAIDIAGQPAAVGFGQVVVGGQAAQAMFAVVRGQDGRIFRLVYAKVGGLAGSDVALFEQSLHSFRPLPAAAAAELKPAQIQLVPVRAGDTVDSLARQMEVDRDPPGLFVLLNGLDGDRALTAGDRVKVIRRD